MKKLRIFVINKRNEGCATLNRGEYLTKVIEDKGFNVMSLSKASGVAYTTIRSMIERNLTNASIDNVLKICEVLDISVELFNKTNIEITDVSKDVDTIAAHHEGHEWTEEELETINKFKEFVKSQRKDQ